jgi:hypothetical protein
MANKTFTDKQKEIVARKLGYDGPMSGFEKFVKSDPAMERKLNMLTTKFMARGGAVKKYAAGGSVQGAVDAFNAAVASGDYSGAASIAQNAGYSAADVATYVNANASNLGLGPSTGFTGVSAGDVQSLYSAPSTSAPAATTTAPTAVAKPAASTTTPTTGTSTAMPAGIKPASMGVDADATNMLQRFDTLMSQGKFNEAAGVVNQAAAVYGEDTYANIANYLNTSDKYADLRQQVGGALYTPQAIQSFAAPPPATTTTAAPTAEETNKVPPAFRATWLGNLTQQELAAGPLRNAYLPTADGTWNGASHEVTFKDPKTGQVRGTVQLVPGAPGYDPNNPLLADALAEISTYGGGAEKGLADYMKSLGIYEQGMAAWDARFKEMVASDVEKGLLPASALNMTREELQPKLSDLYNQQAGGAVNVTTPDSDVATNMLQQFNAAMEAARETKDFSVAADLVKSAAGIFGEETYANIAQYLNTDPQFEWLRTENQGALFDTDNLKTFVEGATKPPPATTTTTTTPITTDTKGPLTTDKPGTVTTRPGEGGGVVFNIPETPATPTTPSMEVAKLGTPGEGQDIVTPESIAAVVAQARQAGTAAQVGTPSATAAPQIDAAKTQGAVQTAVAGNQAIVGTLSQSAQAAAAQATPAETALKDLEAARLTNPQEITGVPVRTLQADELVVGPSVKMSQVEAALSKAEAATAAVKPDMTVQGQLDKLLVDFDSGNPPAWAASSMRNANAVLAARGLGASSLAGQAVIQATLEAAVPLAAQDAQTVAALELQNLSNRQQIAVLTAQQRAAFLGQKFDQSFQARVLNASRVADIANLNFTAEQQIAMENARLAQTVDLANLSNDQAIVMAKAAQMANLESTNLNNRQQSALQNAQAFLQLDLTNLNNQQQTALFNAEKVIQSLFTDTAAENAAKQFNAASQVQVQQFYDSLSTQVGQFNVTQKNAMEQFNVSQENALSQFNAQQSNAMQQFNAQNRLIVDQSNAEWRRQIATIDTAAQNTANQFEAQAGLQINMAEYNNMWQTVRDTMEYAFKASQGYLERQNTLAVAVLQKEAALEAAKYEALGALSARVLGDSGGISGITSSISGGIKSIKDVLGIGSAIADITADSPFTDSSMDFLGDYKMFLEDDEDSLVGYDYWGGSD